LLDFFGLHLVDVLLVRESLLKTFDLLLQVFDQDRRLIKSKARSFEPLNFDVFLLGNDDFFIVSFLVSDLLLE